MRARARDAVDERGDAVTEHLSAIGEVADVTEAEDGVDQCTTSVENHLPILHVIADNLGAGFA